MSREGSVVGGVILCGREGMVMREGGGGKLDGMGGVMEGLSVDG